MSMQAMNPNAGGPVGGIIMMNNGSPAVSVGMNADARSTLNAYIYDYLLKNGHYSSARCLVNDDKFEFQHGQKLSPGRRKDADMNGDGDGMDMDPKDEAPDDLPRPHNWTGTSGSAFLFEWFNIFMDLFSVHSNRTSGGKGAVQAAQYLMHEKNNQRMRESLQNQNLNHNRNNAAMMQMRAAGMANGKMPQGMSQQQMQAFQQQQQQKRQQAMLSQQMARGEQSDSELNGIRPGTPTEGDAAASPSKRPRIDNGQQNFQPGVMPNGRPAGVPGNPNQGMLMQSGFNPAMAQQFQRNGAMPQKPMQVPNAMMNASSPMMANMNQFSENMSNMDIYNRQNMPGQQQMQGGGAQSGNHALQDYQMQLMLLEQQNKKRLMMARQEQHENNPNGTGMPGVGMQGGLSPSGSRTGSPSANEGLNGRSPAAMNFMGNMPGAAEFNPGMFMKDQQMMNPGGPQMRPPTSNDVNMRQAGARPNFPGGLPMQQQGSQAGQQMGTPGQRTDMPPPSAPPTGAQQRNNGNSPSGNAPPTPSQTAKPNPKGKKGAAKEDAKRQRPNKKGSTANAPASDDNPPATPQPSTPITPNNPGVMNNGNKGQPGMQPGNQHQQNQAIPMNQQIPQNDFTQMDFNNGAGAGGEPFNLDFSTLENADVLENFDFDSFLNTSADDGFNFGTDVEIGQGFGMGEGE